MLSQNDLSRVAALILPLLPQIGHLLGPSERAELRRILSSGTRIPCGVEADSTRIRF